MKNLFVPYAGREPAAISVKGHRFLLLSREPGIIESAFELIGADGLRTISNSDTIQEDESLDELARVVDGSVVIVPDKSTVYDMIESLQSELPWLH